MTDRAKPWEPVDDEARKQIVAQCQVVAHLAQTIANVHRDLAEIYGHPTTHLSGLTGSATARLMEDLGDILNGMDAVTDDDNWCAPIFKRAQELWPTDQGEPSS